MGKAGRPGVPAEIKKLTGTYREDRAKKGVSFELISEVPKPEVWMSTKAKSYFKTQCEILIRHKLLDVGNVQMVALMSEEWSLYEKACRELKREGEVFTTPKGYQQQSPWISIRNQAQKNYREIAALFGLDLLSGQKIGGTGGDEKDPFMKLLEEYGK